MAAMAVAEYDRRGFGRPSAIPDPSRRRPNRRNRASAVLRWHALTNWMTALMLRLSNRSMMQIPPPRKRLIPDPDRRKQRQKRARSNALPRRAPHRPAPLRAEDRMPDGKGRA